MDVHQNARLTPHCRALLVERVMRRAGRSVRWPQEFGDYGEDACSKWVQSISRMKVQQGSAGSILAGRIAVRSATARELSAGGGGAASAATDVAGDRRSSCNCQPCDAWRGSVARRRVEPACRSSSRRRPCSVTNAPGRASCCIWM